MTLNRMYHCVPRIISGLSQMSGLSLSATIAETAIGNSRLAGKAARNCATGCTIRAARGRSADPDADRHPDHAGQGDQHDDAAHGERGRAANACRHRPSAEPLHDEAHDLPERQRGEREQ